MKNNITPNTLFNQGVEERGKKEWAIPLILSRSCNDCLYFPPYDKVYALYYWLSKTRNDNYIPSEYQGREKFISPKLTVCRNFRQKQEKPVEIRLETRLDLSKISPKYVKHFKNSVNYILH